MEQKDKFNNFPKYILNAPKIKYKKPTIRPIPLILTESSFSIDHTDSDTEDNFSSEDNDYNDEFVNDMKSNSTLIKNNTVIQN